MTEGDQKNVDTDTREPIYTLHLFAGAGGGILGDLLLGHIPVGAVEIEAYPRKVLLARQLDGSLPRFPIWDDVCTFRRDNPDTASYIERLRGIKDRLCICGGFPCQDISCAGKGAGLDGERSGLWHEFARIVGEIRPAYVFIENSSMLVVRGLDRVVCDLTAMGYDATWGVFSAADAGARHERERLWIVADSIKVGRRASRQREMDTRVAQQVSFGPACGTANRESNIRLLREWVESRAVVSSVGNVDDVVGRMDRLSAIGNGQCPQVVKIAWELLR